MERNTRGKKGKRKGKKRECGVPRLCSFGDSEPCHMIVQKKKRVQSHEHHQRWFISQPCCVEKQSEK